MQNSIPVRGGRELFPAVCKGERDGDHGCKPCMVRTEIRYARCRRASGTCVSGWASINAVAVLSELEALTFLEDIA